MVHETIENPSRYTAFFPHEIGLPRAENASVLSVLEGRLIICTIKLHFLVSFPSL